MRVYGLDWINWRDAKKIMRPVSLAGALLLLTLIWFRIPQAKCVVYEETARIHSVDYKIVKESLFIQTTISYSFSQATILKIRVETTSPPSVQDQTVMVDAGISVKSADFELRPPPSSGSLYVSISLYLSNERNEDVSLLHVKNVDVDIGEAIGRGQIATFGPVLLMAFGLTALLTVLYLRRRKPRGKDVGKRRRGGRR
jgi:hypothetical protein